MADEYGYLDFEPSDDPKVAFWYDLLGRDPIIDNYMDEFMTPGVTPDEQQNIYDSMAEYLDWIYDLDLNQAWDWKRFREVVPTP
jgi:hypothetical protein